MKAKFLACIVAVVVAASGCGGASDKQVGLAKAAQYNATADQVFDIALQVTQRDYKIGETDAAGHKFVTEPQFYNREGGRQSPGDQGFINMSDRSVSVQLLVEIVPTEGGKQAVLVSPVTLQVIAGSPKPRELKPDDPQLPGWIPGRVDALALAIYEAAKGLAEPAPGSGAPAPAAGSGEPAPAGTEPAAATPEPGGAAAGSGAL